MAKEPSTIVLDDQELFTEQSRVHPTNLSLEGGLLDLLFWIEVKVKSIAHGGGGGQFSQWFIELSADVGFELYLGCSKNLRLLRNGGFTGEALVAWMAGSVGWFVLLTLVELHLQPRPRPPTIRHQHLHRLLEHSLKESRLLQLHSTPLIVYQR